MEIERKWMVTGWPEGLPMEEEFAMRQGYISVRPTVRIREEALAGGRTDYVLCFKSEGGLAREEIERSIDKELFEELEHKIIGKPLIPKTRRTYRLLVCGGGVPHRGRRQRLAACRLGPCRLPERRGDRPARPEHGGLLAADPRLTPLHYKRERIVSLRKRQDSSWSFNTTPR